MSLYQVSMHVMISFFLFSLTFFSKLEAKSALLDPVPLYILMNPYDAPSLINSVDFHPYKNQFCVTFTQNNKVVLYQIEDEGITIIQALENPKAKLKSPQHAIFTRDGNGIIVANWYGNTFNIYHKGEKESFLEGPTSLIKYPKNMKNHKPHGMALSPDGKYLAVAYGASLNDPKAVALFKLINPESQFEQFELVDLANGKYIQQGVPKGITFSPDGTFLLVTFAHSNSIAIFPINWNNEKIDDIPEEFLEGPLSQISRPEDIKFTRDGNMIAVSNSNKNTITFYRYDNEINSFIDKSPIFTLDHPEANLSFPHGLSFSFDGTFLSVTQFGFAEFDNDGCFSSWGKERNESIALYKMN